MRLAALIILDHFLIETPSIINFGGPYTYAFKLSKSQIELVRFEQNEYIPNFFGERITNLSAIVGANGVGKTSIMRVLNKKNDDTKAVFIYEDEKLEIRILNRTGNINEHGYFTEESQLQVIFDNKEPTGIVDTDIPSLYYTPIVDYDLVNVESPISQTKHFKNGLEDFHLDSVERNVLFMSEKIIEDLKVIYPNLPTYDKLNIRSKPLYKRDLRKLYGGFKEKGDIEDAQEKLLDELWELYAISAKDKEQYIHDSTDFFRDLEISIFSYLIIDETAMQTAFNGGLESITEIHSKATFEEKLKHTFFRKISHIDKYISRELKASYHDDYHMLLFIFEGNNFDQEIRRKENKITKLITDSESAVQSANLNESIDLFKNLIGQIREELEGPEFQNIYDYLHRLINDLNQYSERNLAERGLIKKMIESLRIFIRRSFDHIYRSRLEIINQLKDAASRGVRLFDSIKQLYLALEAIQSKQGANNNDGVLTLNLSEINYDSFKYIINHYRKVLSEFHSNSAIGRVQLLEFFPNKRLSFGEKSLLSFFSSVYEFTLNKYYHERRKKDYLLLLDETDLGYHPIWKKKFISALVKVLPEIFSQLEYDSEDLNGNKEVKKGPNIQIILSTHDPLTLSDIPNNHISYLNKIEHKTVVLNQDEKPKHSFGANITDLLANSFFVGDGLVGDFVKDRIESVIEWINSDSIGDINQLESSNNKIKKIIELIDEPILKTKLLEMYGEKTGENVRNQILDEQIAYLNSLKSDKHKQ